MSGTVHFEYDPERLIEEVKKRPGIWDVEHDDYRSKPMRYKSWSEIVMELMVSDVKVSKSDMRELELQLQKKWKSMRDCFQKYISNPTRTKRPYIYSKQLQFLLKNNSKNLPEQDSCNSDDDDRNRRVWLSKRKFKLSRRSSEEDADDRSNDANDSPEVLIDVPPKIANLGTSKPVMDEFVFANVDSHNRSDYGDSLNKTEYDDPDKMFLLSLLPHLKSVPEQYRLNVKMDMMQVLRNATYTNSTDHKILQ